MNSSAPKGSSECTCDYGFRQTDLEKDVLECHACPPDLICPGGGLEVLSCAAQSLHDRGACICKEGMFCDGMMDSTCLQPASCRPCPENSYCTDNEVYACPKYSSSPANSSSVQSCICDHAHYRVSDTCIPCPVSSFCIAEQRYLCFSFSQSLCEAGLKFSPSSQTSACVPCARGARCQEGEVLEEFCHMRDRTANDAHSSCVCLPGFWEDYTETCMECQPGTVKPEPGNGE